MSTSDLKIYWVYIKYLALSKIFYQNTHIWLNVCLRWVCCNSSNCEHNNMPIIKHYLFSCRYRSPSADEAVRLLVSMGVPRRKLAVGAPAFGRAVANVSATAGLGWGLFAPLTNDTQAPCTPHTQPDQCSSHPPRWTCGGTYSYKFITANMLSSGVLSSNCFPCYKFV